MRTNIMILNEASPVLKNTSSLVPSLPSFFLLLLSPPPPPPPPPLSPPPPPPPPPPLFDCGEESCGARSGGGGRPRVYKRGGAAACITLAAPHGDGHLARDPLPPGAPLFLGGPKGGVREIDGAGAWIQGGGGRQRGRYCT